MSLSTLTPHVCSRSSMHHQQSLQLNRMQLAMHPPPLDWDRIRQVTVIAAIATSFSQFVSAPLDVATRIMRKATPGTSLGLVGTLSNSLKTKGPLALFSGLPLHLLKRCPTKALTVALFELGTQALLAQQHTNSTQRKHQATLTTSQHLTVALAAGSFAMLATYPIHLSYYALRKGVSFSKVIQSVRKYPRVLYSGTIPALLSTAPAVMVDYSVYRSLRRQIDEYPRSQILNTSAIVIAAAMSNVMGGFISEPFKLLSRNMAVESVKTASCKSLAVCANTIMKGGVGEFWRGFPLRSLRYAVSAVVSKATVQKLQCLSSNITLPSPKVVVTGDLDVDFVPAKLHSHAFVQPMQFGNINCLRNAPLAFSTSQF